MTTTQTEAHEHYMVKGRKASGFRAARSIAVTVGPFHTKAEAVEAGRGLVKPQILFYAPGTLTHD